MSQRRITIQRTTDYLKFTRAIDNRLTDAKKHRKLRESMQKYGFLPYWPIVVRENGNGTYHIEDGQHRHLFARQLTLPIYFVVANDDFSIAEVNNTQKIWSVVDYVDCYIEKQIDSYRIGKEFKERYKIPITTAFALLAGTASFSNIDAEFRSGEFVIKDQDWAERVATVYSQIAQLSSEVSNVRFLETCMALCRVESFDSKRLIQGAKRCREKLVAYANRDGYLSMCEELYNYSRSQLFPLKVEAQMAMRKRNAAVVKKKK